MSSVRFVVAQCNFTVGDIDHNAEKILTAAKNAKIKHNADIVIFSELALCGYPPEDLLFRSDFLLQINQALEKIKKKLPEDVCIILGYPENKKNKIYNSAIVLTSKKIIANYRKQLLPNYGVFDEKRYFTKGNKPCVFTYKQCKIGLGICEDFWHKGPAIKLKKAGAQILVLINASPFYAGKLEKRIHTMQKRVAETKLPLLYAHHYGVQDDLVFDGSSFVLDKNGYLIAKAPFAEEYLLEVEVKFSKKLTLTGNIIDLLDNDAKLYKALVLSIRDYVQKNGFKKILLGFSGGIDSALTAVIAMDALGEKNILPVILPSRYTSSLSLYAAHQQLKIMGVNYKEISIEAVYRTLLSSLDILDIEKINDLTQQNLQARARAVILMAISNQTGALLLNTSNKSELAVGYGTLYGDMCGAYSVIKDLWKTDVYRLARYRNQVSQIIPQEIIDRPPSAELAPDQLDSDTLPPYEILDEILKLYIEKDKAISEIVAAGFDLTTVKRIIAMVTLSEYKRKQSPLGPRVSQRAFTRERRYPITSAFDATSQVQQK